MKIGVDIVDIKRIARMTKNARFLERVYTDREIAYCMPKRNRAQHFAVRFAAKEAVWKALGTNGISHRDIGVVNRPDGKPVVMIRGKARRDLELSLSHTDEYAVAVALKK